MALFKKKVELNRFLHNAIAATFTGGFPIAQVDPDHLLTAEQRVRAADLLRVRSLIAHYFALVAEVGAGVPVDTAELGRRYQEVLWHVLLESTRTRAEAEGLAMQWERGVHDVYARIGDGPDEGSQALAEVAAVTARILERALDAEDNPLQVDVGEYGRVAAEMVTQHSVRALTFALAEVKLVS